MAPKASPKLFCFSCRDNEYCIVYWGLDCKRQGGSRIPRMKTMNSVPSVNRQQIVMSTNSSNYVKHKLDLFEPIRTKSSKWSFNVTT